MAEYFESFADAWVAFLARSEPLEVFYDEFRGGSFNGDVWVIQPTVEVRRATLRLQGELERFDFLSLVPHHFLHVAVPQVVLNGLGTTGPIDLDYAQVNCFHTAVVAEVDAPALRVLADDATFLPHLTLAVVTRAASADELRAVLVELRERPLGRQRLDEVLRVHVELSPERGLEPWTIVDRVAV